MTSRFSQYCGLAGIVLIIFGLIIALLVDFDPYLLMPIHFALGAFFLCLFLVKGGIGSLKSSAARKATGLGTRLVFSTITFVAMLVVINYIVDRKSVFRYDSTAEKVYTLAPQTIQTLKALDVPIIVRAFYLGGKVEPQSTADLLRRLAEQTKNFRWVAIDPEKQPTLTEKFGISQSGTLHFSVDNEQTNAARSVKISRDISEQEIVNALLKLTRSGERIVYNIVGHGEANLTDNSQSGFLFLKEAIEGENIVLRNLALQTEKKIPDDAQALLLLAPKRDLLPEERELIEKFLSDGGSALFLSEPQGSDDIRNLVRPLGITIGKDMIVDQVVRLFAGPSLGVQPMVTQYAKHSVTENFSEGTVFSTASSVRASSNKPKNSEVTELAFSSDHSWAETNLPLLLGDDPQAAQEPTDIAGPVSIAAAYEKQLANDGVAEKKSSRAVVIGDVDFASNGNIHQLFNRDFFLNALNWTVGESKGVTIRARTLRRSTKGLTVEEFASMFAVAGILLPELLLLIGLGVWWSRRN